MTTTTEHDLKCWPEHFEPVRTGQKRFELRFNDRDYKQGDVLLLREWDPAKETYTGRYVKANVQFILTPTPMNVPGWDARNGWVIMGIDVFSWREGQGS